MVARYSKRLRKALLLFLISGLLIALLKIVKMKPVKYSIVLPDQSSISVAVKSKYYKLAPYISAMARHETGNFKSRLFREGNNMFGMKKAYQRKQVGAQWFAASDGGHYMKYESPAQSLEDLLLWMDARRFPQEVKDARQFVEELKKRNYFGDTVENYFKGVNYWLQNG